MARRRFPLSHHKMWATEEKVAIFDKVYRARQTGWYGAATAVLRANHIRWAWFNAWKRQFKKLGLWNDAEDRPTKDAAKRMKELQKHVDDLLG